MVQIIIYAQLGAVVVPERGMQVWCMYARVEVWQGISAIFLWSALGSKQYGV